ncbi:hypothetical protein CY34DRAFT_806214 [Suillus luteus UH-Slu-Lm8-n1]|uniref:Uncharacterized protein n=1 Tax=Suillus luteus UH-Slu-Lm8-n1 TaxID=930992 RepID=A0A0C9ZTT2_9AGAM|nr:hypothetical protein CY34DRAFT_806214 [Suillus luteus UH-Slu-Lm8-n1]
MTPVNVPCNLSPQLNFGVYVAHASLRRSPPGNTPLQPFMALRMRLSVLPSSYWATSSQKAEYSGREMQKRTL